MSTVSAVRRPVFVILAATAACCLALSFAATSAQVGTAVAIDNDDIRGGGTSTKGPEGGVWVSAETPDLPTKMSRTVVTDDRGRYVVPDLPKATYALWVRGYGLVDSPKVTSAPGRTVNLTAIVAPSPRAAAEYYPANYWFALLNIPDKSEFPGTGPRGNGISPAMRSQAQWISNVKTTGCTPCHQLGNKATRELPSSLGTFNSTAAAWNQRVQSGIDGGGIMYAYANR